MDQPWEPVAPPLPGFRLAKLEMLNWGTFDGAVHSIQPQGQSTLLIGENGSGKSTLVDAILTLLVRPTTRNYNVAAGAAKNERDERTYIRGAYDRILGEDGRSQVVFLRKPRGQFTALLAVFENAEAGKVFTLCQVLYLNAELAVERVYACADGERGIVRDLGELNTTQGVAKQLRGRGFRTSSSYQEYFQWLQAATGMRAKAMDVFNQTVAVKDVQRLDTFMRQHMLERKSWQERVTQLLRHFNELSDAHRILVRTRQQYDLLRPIAEQGQRYQLQQAELQASELRLAAVPVFFARQQVDLLEKLSQQWQLELQHGAAEIERLEKHQDQLRHELVRCEAELGHASGQRYQQLSDLIAQSRELEKLKCAARAAFQRQLQAAGITSEVANPEQLLSVHSQIQARRQQLSDERDAARAQYNTWQYQLGRASQQLSHARAEAAATGQHASNLPRGLLDLRQRVCAALNVSSADLPFVAELIRVSPASREWEASIEQVLYSFARSMLVPEELISAVARYVDHHRLVDAHGEGLRLAYYRVGQSSIHHRNELTQTRSTKGRRDNLSTATNGLPGKLEFREHPLAAWVRNEIETRFNYLACDSVEDFVRAPGPAMTRQSHFKSSALRHEKDDRRARSDRRSYVLGWQNEIKQASMVEALERCQQEVLVLERHTEQGSALIDRLTESLAALDQAARTQVFDCIDDRKHADEVARLESEQRLFEQSQSDVQALKRHVADLQARIDACRDERDRWIARRTNATRESHQGGQLLKRAQESLARASQSGKLAVLEQQFPAVLAASVETLDIGNLTILPERVERQVRRACEDLRQTLQPLARELTAAMTRYLRRFPEEHTDLDAHVDALSGFIAIYERIVAEDLPQFEARFKGRLNENVAHELGLLYGGLESEREEIRAKIEQLNQTLQRLSWKPGTYMQLETADVQDREILEFRRELANCLTDSLAEGTALSEATFTRMESLISRLRDEANTRWRDKVIDVRNWFSFAAREVVAATGEVRSFYEGGSGQSGGEKGKLAFLVLVAAIAYQYDLDADTATSDRFHFVMVDEMFSRSDDRFAEYALELFEQFHLQLLIVAPLDAKARVTEPYVGAYVHVLKDRTTHRSELLSITADQMHELKQV